MLRNSSLFALLLARHHHLFLFRYSNSPPALSPRTQPLSSPEANEALRYMHVNTIFFAARFLKTKLAKCKENSVSKNRVTAKARSVETLFSVIIEVCVVQKRIENKKNNLLHLNRFLWPSIYSRNINRIKFRMIS